MPVADVEYFGFGAVTPGGTGQSEFHVTNLNSSGPGSLRDAVSASNRFIVFDVAGEIPVLSGPGENEIRVLGDHITIAGETAPQPGITITGRGIIMRGDLGAHDVICRYLRIRNVLFDCMQLFRGAYNIVLDHLSLRRADDGACDISGDAQSNDPSRTTYNVTLSNCFLHTGSTSNKTQLIGYRSKRISVWRNLYRGNQRNPQYKWNPTDSEFLEDPQVVMGPPPDDTCLDFRNNLIWEWVTQGSWLHHEGLGNFVGNYYSAPSRPKSDQVHALTIGDPDLITGTATDRREGFAFCYENFSADNLSFELDSRGNKATPYPTTELPILDPWASASLVRQSAGVVPVFPRDAEEQAIVDSIVLQGRPRQPVVQIIPTFAASRARWNGITFDLPERTVEAAPAITAIRGVNALQSGHREYLFSRYDYTARVDLLLESPEYQAFRMFWEQTAGPGGAFEFWLDRWVGSAWSFERTLADQNGLVLTMRNAPSRIPYAEVGEGRGVVLSGNRDLSVFTAQASAPQPTNYDDPFDYREGIVAVRVRPAFAAMDSSTRVFVDTEESLSPPGSNRLLLWKTADNHVRFDVWDGTGLNRRVYHVLTPGVDTWEAGQGLELVARWGADGTLTAWYAVDAGTFIKMEQLDVTGNGLMSALPPRLLIGARNDQSGRAAGTYESVTFWKRAWSGDTPWRLFAARRPVWRNYYGRGELLSAEFEPDRPVLSRHLWRVTVNLRSV